MPASHEYATRVAADQVGVNHVEGQNRDPDDLGRGHENSFAMFADKPARGRAILKLAGEAAMTKTVVIAYPSSSICIGQHSGDGCGREADDLGDLTWMRHEHGVA